MEWYAPDPRGIIPIDGFNLPRSTRKLLSSGRFEVRTDTAFAEVMRACAAPRPEQGELSTWIDERLIEAYVGLADDGNAHSVEAWIGDSLVGGLYGVHLGAAFFGESMFIRADLGGSGASKVCLAVLVSVLKARGFRLLDTQFWNPHLDQFGCLEIPRERYLLALQHALAVDADWPTTSVLANAAEHS